MPSPEIPDDSWSHPDFSPGETQSDGVENGLLLPVPDVEADVDASAEQETNGSVSDMIMEGKHNARAVLAASGLSADSQLLLSDGQPALDSPSNSTNGTAKRSRSGSIALSAASPGDHRLVLVRESLPEKVLLEQYVFREFQHSALEAWHNPSQEILRQKRQERENYLALRREHHQNPTALYGPGYDGFGNARTDLKNQHPQLLYPASRRRAGGRKARELRVSRKDLKLQNEQIEDLVPIRLDIDWDKVKIRDTFTWNLHDRVTSPDLFAEKLVEDLGLPLESYVPLVRQISQSIHEQLGDYYPQVFIEEDPVNPHLPYSAYKNDEMRVLIKLNITIGQHTLVDQFEWEINNPYNSSEEFALQMTTDLSLSGEFTTAIAHSIREQAQLYTRSLYILSHPFDGRPIDDPDLKSAFLPSPLLSPFRPFQAAKEFTPYLYELNDLELERTEVSISREQRRQKRSVNRRGGPALPDLKDRQRTIRTMIVSSVLPNSASTIEETHLFKRSGTSRSRRSAAGHRDGADESDMSDSEDSSMGSPAIGSHLAQGTARTRGMRGAASVAQAALRANFGHSATPEPSLHHHESRIPRRRDLREESVDEPPDKLIVKLKISRDRFRQFLKDMKSRGKQPSTPSFPGPTPASQASQSSTPKVPTPTLGSMAPPQPQNQQAGGATILPRPSSSTSQSHTPVQQIGAIDAPHPLPPSVPSPHAPTWLVSGLAQLKRSYPNDSFEGIMRYSAVDTTTLTPVANANVAHPGQRLKYQYLPRIRCHDCPGKLYTPGPGTTVDNFEVHLKNRQHKERVEERLAKGTSTGTTPS
ncbi:hypothetical protein Egran_06246 [Elaphomyces granulatus]|uniref:Uncharacterized protein n=1 Tax=Elaphomyces granulatus TaxID=519963 RepID=A0A232LPA9_9EURO|nr:hypothetical protein Egran_06246 [Elaphomyces granulatus]